MTPNPHVNDTYKEIAVSLPRGTTHVLMPTFPEQDVTYMAWTFQFVGPESGNSYYRWYTWDRGAWRKDMSGFCNRHNRLQTVWEYVSNKVKEKQNGHQDQLHVQGR